MTMKETDHEVLSLVLNNDKWALARALVFWRTMALLLACLLGLLIFTLAADRAIRYLL